MVVGPFSFGVMISHGNDLEKIRPVKKFRICWSVGCFKMAKSLKYRMAGAVLVVTSSGRTGFVFPDLFDPLFFGLASC